VGERDPTVFDVAVRVGANGSSAFRPGRVLVPKAAWQAEDRGALRARLGADVIEDAETLPTLVILDGVADVEAALALIEAEGIDPRPDTVFFAVPSGAGVSSAPVTFGGVTGSPVTFGGVGGAPVTFGGVGGAPVTFGGVAGTPVTFGGVGGAPVTFGGILAVPVTFGGVGGAPVTFGAGGSGPGLCPRCAGGAAPVAGGRSLPSTPAPPRRSTAKRAATPTDPEPDERGCRVVVVDTGFAEEGVRPAGLDVDGVAFGGARRDLPDVDGDRSLDPASGHATFIAGVVRRLAPRAQVEIHQVLSTFGDASDAEVAQVLEALATRLRDEAEAGGEPPHTIVNLSFAGYSDDDETPPAIASALAALKAQGAVLVAAAGNDSTCRPAYPAASAGVLAVGALDEDGPAWFTNHGPWVQACAPGVDVLSRFFRYAEGAPAAESKPTGDEDHAQQPDGNGWARWSGTSFAAPIVAGVLARRITEGARATDAVRAVVEDPALFRLPWLGTVVNERPW
jgi:hypothetical protein